MADNKLSVTLCDSNDHTNMFQLSIPKKCKNSSDIKVVYIQISDNNQLIGVVLGRTVV